jgi:hypothetical protein
MDKVVKKLPQPIRFNAAPALHFKRFATKQKLDTVQSGAYKTQSARIEF